MQRETDAIELPAAGARCEKGRTSMGAADNRRHLRQVSHWSHSHSSMLAKLAMLSAASLARLEALSLPVKKMLHELLQYLSSTSHCLIRTDGS